MPYIGKSPSAGVRQRYQYTATAGQTTFTGTDLGNLTLTYTDNNFVDVFQNGVLLKGGTTDYTATSGTSVVLTTGASVSDVIEIIVYDVFSVGNFYNRTDSDSRYVNVDGDTMTGTLALNVSGSSHLTTTTSGTSNLVLGVNAGNSIASGGNYNVALGDEAGTAITTGDNNVAIGFEALKSLETSSQNTAIGHTALKLNTVANNTAVGYGALSSDTQGSKSVALGRSALATQNFSSATDSHNTAVGYLAGTAVTTGQQNTLIGGLAGDALVDANNNVAVGYLALSSDTKGYSSVAVGSNALKTQNFTSATDSFNTAVGFDAGGAVTTGVENVFVGDRAGDAVTTGQRNIAIGSQALTTNTVADNCVAIGQGALYAHNVGSNADTNNTAVGYQAGVSVTTGIKNTLIGASAGNHIEDGQLAIVVGFDSDTNGTGDGNQIVIGNNITGAGANNVKFGTSGGTATLGLDGSDTSWAASSDLRLKTNVADCAVGLDFIKDLRPITFKWNNKDAIANTLAQYDADSSDPVYGSGKTQHGFIAQEVKTAINAHSGLKDGFTMWSEDPDGTQQVAPSALIPMLTKAVQELSAKNDALEARIKKLEDG